MKVMGGVLYRRYEAGDGTTMHWQVIMPKTMRSGFLERVHSDKTAGHLGIDKTLKRVLQRAYWFGWRDQVAAFCKKCILCASRKPPSRKSRAPMQQHLTGAPLERVSMDVLGPLPKSDSNNKFVLLICDYFTKWVEAFPMPNQEAKTVADLFVKEFICRYGVPKKMFSDQGSNFQSGLFREVCRLLDIDKSRTSPYHPQSDGLVERMNRTIEAMISMYISPGQRDWDQFLPYIMMAYRSAVQSTTGYTPNRMMLGREVDMPIDLIIGVPDEEKKKVSEVEYVEKLRTDLEQVHAVAREHIKCRSDKQKKHYDLKSHIRRYEECDLVWIHNPAKKKGISPKLTRSWEGPYMIVNRLSDVTYRIKGGLRAKLKVVHFDRLKPYLGEVIPEWVQCEIKRRDERNRKLEFEKEIESAMLDDTILYEYEDEDVDPVPPNIGDNEKVGNMSEKKAGAEVEPSVIDHQMKNNSEAHEYDNMDEDLGLRRSKRTIKKPGRYVD